MKRTAPSLILEILVISTVLHQDCPALVNPHMVVEVLIEKEGPKA